MRRTGTTSAEDAQAPTAWMRLAAIAIIAAVTQIALTIAFTSLTFRDRLAPDLALGLAGMLAGLLVTGAVVGMRSGLGGHVVGPQDSGLVVLSVVAPSIALQTDAAGETVVVLMAISSLAVGATLIGLGRFRLGRMVRYLPYPVMAGFLAGTGLVMAIGTYELASSGISGDASGGGDRLGRLAVAVGLALLMTAISRSTLPTERLMPGLVMGSIVGFTMIRLVAGLDRAEGDARGWLLPRLPPGPIIDGDTFGFAGRADWGVVVQQLPAIAPLLLLAPLTLLLYLGALEATLDVELDTDREFRVIGSVNLVAGLFGSAPAYTQFANTMLVQRMAGPVRAVPVAIAASAIGVIAIGDPVVALVPLPVVAGMLGFIAASFLLDWIWDLRHRVSPAELALAALIALSIPAFGYLAGVGIGLVLAAGWFVVQYSRISGVRSVRPARSLASNVSRPDIDQQTLAETGGEVLVVTLEGFLFFGTGDSVSRACASRDDVSEIRWIVLDCARVTGADSSAAASFGHLARSADHAAITLVWAGLHTNVERALLPLFDEARGGRRFTDLDHALEWTEQERLAARPRASGAPDVDTILDRLPDLRSIGVVVDYQAGDVVFRRGEPSPGLTILESGRVSVRSADPTARRRQLGAGSVLGEVGLYRDAEASATVVADEACRLILIDRPALEQLHRTDPEAALELHTFIGVTLADRLVRANDAIDALGG